MLETLRSIAVPVFSVIAPELGSMVDGTEVPVILSIAVRMSCTVPVVRLMVPPLALVLVGAVLLKVIVFVPVGVLTVMVLPLTKLVDSAGGVVMLVPVKPRAVISAVEELVIARLPTLSLSVILPVVGSTVEAVVVPEIWSIAVRTV